MPSGILFCFAHKTFSFDSLENFNDGARQFAESIDNCCACFAQCGHFSCVRSTSAFNDRTCMTEASSLARGFTADVCDDWLGDLAIVNQLREFFFLGRTNFAKDHDCFSERICFEHQRSFWNANAKHRIAADMCDGGNANTSLA